MIADGKSTEHPPDRLGRAMKNIWEFQADLTRRLALGAVISILLGLGMLLLHTPLWRGMAFQFIGWGAVDWIIAIAGAIGSRRARARQHSPEAPEVTRREAQKLERILWINTGLDVLYMLGGALVALFPGASNAFWLGTGIGIVLQGGFLFFFDLIHAWQIRQSVLPR